MQPTHQPHTPPHTSEGIDTLKWQETERHYKAHIQAQIDNAHLRWQPFGVDPAAFLSFAIQRWPHGGSIEQAIQKLRWEELYLVFACLHGCPRATEVFEREYLRPLTLRCNNAPNIEAMTDDVRHQMWEMLFCATNTHPPKLQQYKGIGTLRGWLQTIAYRESMGLLRKQAQYPTLNIELVEISIEHQSPEAMLLKQTHIKEFKAALQAELGALSAKERNLLRYHFLEGWSMEKLSRLYRVHRSTISRQIDKLHQELLRNTIKGLEQRTGLEAAELQRIAQMMQSQIELSLQRILIDA